MQQLFNVAGQAHSFEVFKLGLPIFLACLVEMVEALTIVLAIGVSRGWRSTAFGAITALAVLTELIVVFGGALSRLPIHWLWLILGGLLAVFGLQWLRKSILRYGGVMALHDEAAVFKQVQAEAKQQVKSTQREVDWYVFVVAFKGVLLEGLEVVFIILAFGASQGNLRTGVWAAILALVVVAGLGLLIHRPLTRVPENSLKFVVGIVLTSFGTFFGAAGAGIHWPHGEAAVLGIMMFYLIVAFILICWLKLSSSSDHVRTKAGTR